MFSLGLWNVELAAINIHRSYVLVNILAIYYWGDSGGIYGLPPEGEPGVGGSSLWDWQGWGCKDFFGRRKKIRG